ncbi:MAG: NPCBM/NEW2 domain-containing protein [Planctomycetota bacterium]
MTIERERPSRPVGLRILALILSSALWAPALRAQPASVGFGAKNRVLLSDGRLLDGQVTALDGSELTISGAGGELATVPAGELVAIHGVAAESKRSARALLVGGEELRGEVLGGDEYGDTFLLGSTVLGQRRVALDRLEMLIFEPPEGVEPIDPERLELPEDADEVLFLRTDRGFDRLVGEVYRFTRRSIRFQSDTEEEPVGRRFRELVGFGLRGGFEREDEPTHILTTRTGDRIGIGEPALRDGRLAFTAEGGESIEIEFTDVTALVALGEGRQFLSSCELQNVEQSSWFGDGSAPLFPLRVDRAVDGSLLSVARLGGGTGLGVHSKTSFEVVVPEGVTGLVGTFGIDDSAEQLSVRACVDVFVEHDGARLFEQSALRIGRLVSLGRLEVEPGQVLRFVVDFGPGLDLGDRVDWIDVAFVR